MATQINRDWDHVFFFFSSRRRHTRSKRDWSSDVCSSDLSNPGMWQVNFTLSPEAARRFGPFTEQNKGRQMAIVLSHRVYSAPVINGRIDDIGVIEGNFSQESAHDLALVLRAGALPASIKYLEE